MIKRLKNLLLGPRQFVTFRKWMNSRSIYLQGHYLKNERVRGYPVHLTLDPTNACNLRCPLCPTGAGVAGRPKGMMRYEDFIEILDELGPYLYQLDIFSWGEPILHKRIYDMIAYAKRFHISVAMSANLNVFDEERASHMVASGLDHLSVSLDGASQKTYQAYRVGGDFGTVVRNIEMLLAVRRRMASRTPRVVWQYIVNRANEHEMDAARELAARIGVDAIEFAPINIGLGKEFYVPVADLLKEHRDWLPKSSDCVMYDVEKAGRRHPKSHCGLPWEALSVNWDGAVAPCCAVYDQADDFGNIVRDGYSELFNNEKFRTARYHIRTGGTSNGRPSVVCQNCVKLKAII